MNGNGSAAGTALLGLVLVAIATGIGWLFFDDRLGGAIIMLFIMAAAV